MGAELDLFAHALQALRQERGYAPHVLAITGTNGKTTVTALTGQLLQRAGQTVAVAGNIGPTLLDTLSEQIDAEALPQSWVLELSSFQLHGCATFEPTAATLLNLSQDHLDWHGSMDAYAQDKARVFGQQGVAVLNRDDAAVMALLPQLQQAQPVQAQTAPASDLASAAAKAAADAQPNTPAASKKDALRKKAAAPVRRWVSFGSGLPQRAGDYGLQTVNGMTWLVRATEDETLLVRPRQARKEETSAPLHMQRLMPADLNLTGNPLPPLGLFSTHTESGMPLLQKLDAIVTDLGFTAYTADVPNKLNMFLFTLSLMIGTAGLPHVIIRFFTVPKVSDARSSAGWALVFIALLYTTAPAVGSMARINLVDTVYPQGTQAEPLAYENRPEWMKNWEVTGLLKFEDKNNDGKIQYYNDKSDKFAATATERSWNGNELTVNNDILVLANPEIANLPGWVVGLIAAGGLAAALSTAAGLLLAISSAISHDLIKKTLKPDISEKGELFAARASMTIAIIVATYLGINPPGFAAARLKPDRWWWPILSTIQTPIVRRWRGW